jgi:hypothetical protein
MTILDAFRSILARQPVRSVSATWGRWLEPPKPPVANPPVRAAATDTHETAPEPNGSSHLPRRTSARASA